MKVPQCHSFEDLAIAAMENSNRDYLNAVPDDVLFQILLHCGPRDVDGSMKLVCRRLHNATSKSLDLWKEFCCITGKAQVKSDGVPANRLSFDSKTNFYREFYYRNPCVPIDFERINEALKYCPKDPSGPSPLEDEAMCYSNTGSVVVMPGVHRERINICGEPWVDGQPLKSITVRAAFPSIGAALVYYGRQRADEIKNQPAITVSTRIGDDVDEIETGISVKFSHLKILHSTNGADIWAGNTAVLVDGPRVQVLIDSCILQSDSGRGLVVTNQAELQMTHSSIVDCAATGFYLGDWGSKARVSSCNIVRCGFGDLALRQPASDEERAAVNRTLHNFIANQRIGQPIPRNQVDVVPPGHSGVYIESSMCWVENTLIAGNSLTGLSVVRSGFLNLSDSDITENGNDRAEQIMIEDAHDARNNNIQGMISIRGGIVEGPVANNYVSRGDSPDAYKGGMIRTVPHNIKVPMPLLSLLL